MKSILAFFLLLAVSSVFAEDTQVEYVRQILEPTGGSILRPSSWFYAEGHGGPVYIWTLSREDTSGNHPYTTGVRIQAFTKVKSGTGKTAREFIQDFFDAKKRSAKVVRSCGERDQGLFTRICLETEEGPYHVLYSMYWSSGGADIAIVTTAGTTRDLWETYAPVFQRMGEWELIDMKRFEK